MNEKIHASKYISGVVIDEKTNDVSCYVMQESPKSTIRTYSEEEMKQKSTGIKPRTLKETQKLKTPHLIRYMEGDDNEIVTDASLDVCRFIHSWKITCNILHGKLFLFCECCMDERCGTICRHKWHFWEKYLCKQGFKQFTHRSVHCINYSLYAYLASKSDNVMSTDEKRILEQYRMEVTRGFSGTLCEFDGTLDRDIWVNMISTVCTPLPVYKDKPLDFWNTASARERVVNFSYEFVTSCIKDYHPTTAFDTVNYTSQMSQCDFGVENHLFEDHSKSAVNVIQVIGMDSPSVVTGAERERFFTGAMHELKGLIDFNDHDLFKKVMLTIKDVTADVAMLAHQNSMKRKSNNDAVFFPAPINKYRKKSNCDGNKR